MNDIVVVRYFGIRDRTACFGIGCVVRWVVGREDGSLMNRNRDISMARLRMLHINAELGQLVHSDTYRATNHWA